jgi:hypothetical protein
MNTRKSTDTVQTVTQADLVYGKVGGMSLLLNLYHTVGGDVPAADAALPPWRRLGGGRQVRCRRRAPHADRRERVRRRERELSPCSVGEVPGAGPTT